MTDEQRKKDEELIPVLENYEDIKAEEKAAERNPSDDYSTGWRIGHRYGFAAGLSHARSEHTEEMREAVELITRSVTRISSCGGYFPPYFTRELRSFISKVLDAPKSTHLAESVDNQGQGEVCEYTHIGNIQYKTGCGGIRSGDIKDGDICTRSNCGKPIRLSTEELNK